MTDQDTAADEVAEWADHFKAQGWAPPEEVEELRRDAKRLDWLDSDMPDFEERAFCWNRSDDTVRSAIDAAKVVAEYSD